MAAVYANVGGNWSTVAIWYSGASPYGQLPQSGDTVDINGKIVILDTNVSVVSITNPSSAGYLSITGGNYTINANILQSSAYVTTIASSLPTGTTLTINGNLINTVGAGSGNAVLIHNGAGTVYITGNLYATTLGNIDTNCINNAGVGIINITGTVNSGTGSGQCAKNSSSGTIIFQGQAITNYSGQPPLQNTSTGTIIVNGDLIPSGSVSMVGIAGNSGLLIINGNCYGALSTSPSVSLLASITTGILTINGNVIQRSYSPSTTIGLISLGGTGTININGSVGGGSVPYTIGVSNSSTGTINVTGNITGGTNTTMTPAIYSTTAGIINVSGETVSGLYPALYSTSTTAINRLKGNIKSFNGLLPFVAFKINCDPLSGQTITIQDIGNTDRLFSTSNVSNGAPLPANVRSGIVYGSLNEFTGSTIMATPDNVRKGVLTDNTVGTGQLTAEDFLNAIATGTDPLSIRLQNVSTVQSTGDQISNY